METEKIRKKRFKPLSHLLNERQRTILADIEAQILRYEGTSHLAKATGLSRNTIAVSTVDDFRSLGNGKVTPYGMYGLSQNKGWVRVEVDKDTAAFVVESIRRWQKTLGHTVYAQAN